MPANEEVIGDGVFEFGEIVDSDFLCAIAAHEGGDVPRFGFGDIGNIDRERVHGDAADDGSATAVKENMALVADAGEASAVADRQDGDAHRSGSGEAQPVADLIAFLEKANGSHAGFDVHNGSDSFDAAADGGGKNAEGEDAQADHIEMGLREIEKAAGVAEVSESGAEADLQGAVEEFVEAGELEKGVGLVELIGHGEMAHDALELKVPAGANFFQGGWGFGPAEAIAVHAGVELEMNGQGPVLGAEEGFKGVERGFVTDGRGEVEFEAGVEFGEVALAEQEDGEREAGLAKFDGFRDRSDDKESSALTFEKAGERDGAMAVGVVLNDSGDGELGRFIGPDEVEI